MLTQHGNKFAMNESKTWSTPDTISYSAAVSACEKEVHWMPALALLEEMEECKTPATMINLDSTIRAFGKCALWQLALAVLKTTWEERV